MANNPVKERKKTDAVFEGGGVKGIGLVGAVTEIEKEYDFENLAGTSAGAIVAALLAAGYTGAEIKRELLKLNYRDIKDKGTLDWVGVLGRGLSILFEYGIYEGNYFENWLEALLTVRRKTKFKDLETGDKDERYKYKLQVIATDITDKRLLVLPRDLASFGYDPGEFSVSRAVRMTMSIPIFFEPVKLVDNQGCTHLIVDGGALSNYPVWLLDDGTTDPPWPTFGFKLIEEDRRHLKRLGRDPIRNPVEFVKALAGTMLDAHDNYHISQSKGDFDRTIGIPTSVSFNGTTKEIRTTDFDITPGESEALFQNGADSARKFLKEWDFEGWKKKYRQSQVMED